MSGGKSLEWLKRRWLEFRWGWIYISYIVSLTNFTVITYYLLIQDISLPIPLHIYALLVITTLPPITIAIGHYIHLRHQLEIDIQLTYEKLVKQITKEISKEIIKALEKQQKNKKE